MNRSQLLFLTLLKSHNVLEILYGLGVLVLLIKTGLLPRNTFFAVAQVLASWAIVGD